jgi:hypothetical protein
VSLQRGDACRSTAIRVQQPQLGGLVIAASRKIRRRWMKRDRVNTVAVSLQRGDACRSIILQATKCLRDKTAVRVSARASQRVRPEGDAAAATTNAVGASGASATIAVASALAAAAVANHNKNSHH